MDTTRQVAPKSLFPNSSATLHPTNFEHIAVDQALAYYSTIISYTNPLPTSEKPSGALQSETQLPPLSLKNNADTYSDNA